MVKKIILIILTTLLLCGCEAKYTLYINSNEIKDESKEKMSKKEFHDACLKLEQEMRKAAKELDFEKAMQLRDILFEMKANNKEN